MKYAGVVFSSVLLLVTVAGCSGGQLSTREKGAGIGALGGAAVGGIIGATVGHPGAGAAIGGALGLGAGALIGDQMQGQEQKQAEQQRQIDVNQAELDRQKRDLENQETRRVLAFLADRRTPDEVGMKRRLLPVVGAIIIAAFLAGCSNPLTTREKGAGLGL
jgi:hypothetical protein